MAIYPTPPPSGNSPGAVPDDQMPGYPPPGPPSYAQSAPPPKTRSRRSGLIALGVLVILVVLIVCALILFRDRISGDVNSLQVGDCIDDPSSTISITDVQHQPCTEPHDGEVFANLTYPGANGTAYPGTTAFDDYVRTNCLPAVQTYTGRTLAEIDAAGLSYAYFYPTTSSWTDSNDRGVTCYVENSDGTKLVGSVDAGAAASHSP